MASYSKIYAPNSGIANADLSLVAAHLKEQGKQAATIIRKRVRVAVRDAGQEVLTRIRANASWSTGNGDGTEKWKARNPGRTSIPDATSMKVSFAAKSASAFIDIDRKKAPNARPLEGLTRGVDRHPVYGNTKVWVSQPLRPFFFAAASAEAAHTQELIEAAADQIATDLGFR